MNHDRRRSVWSNEVRETSSHASHHGSPLPTLMGEEQLAHLRIQRIALRLFAERGYADVGIAEIVDACQLTKGAFYYYYQTKEALFRSLVATYMASWECRVMEAVPAGAQWDEQLAAVFQVFLEVLEDRDDAHRDLLILMTLRAAGGPGQHELGFASLQGFAAWIEAVMATHPNASRRHEYATLVHTAGLGALSEAALGADTARDALGAVLEVLGGRPLPAAAELRGSRATAMRSDGVQREPAPASGGASMA